MGALALPMAFGKVPPNRIYGFRTSKTLSSPNIWYQANRVAGRWLMAVSLVTICFNAAVSSMHPDAPLENLIIIMGSADLIALLLSAVASLLYLRKL